MTSFQLHYTFIQLATKGRLRASPNGYVHPRHYHLVHGVRLTRAVDRLGETRAAAWIEFNTPGGKPYVVDFEQEISLPLPQYYALNGIHTWTTFHYPAQRALAKAQRYGHPGPWIEPGGWCWLTDEMTGAEREAMLSFYQRDPTRFFPLRYKGPAKNNGVLSVESLMPGVAMPEAVAHRIRNSVTTRVTGRGGAR